MPAVLLLLGALYAQAPATSTAALDLEQLVALAMDKSPQLFVSRAELQQAEALYKYAKAQAYPKGSVQGLFGGPTAEAKTEVVNDLSTVTRASLKGNFNFGQLGVGLRLQGSLVQPLYTFGKLSAAKEAGAHMVRAAEHKQAATRAEIILNLHKAFWAYQLTRSLDDSAEEGEGTLVKILERVEELLDADSPQVTENDRLRLKYTLDELRIRRAQITEGREAALLALHLLIGRPQGEPLSLVEADLSELPEAPPEADQAVADALAGRPELRALSEVRAAAAAFTEYRRANLWPTIFLAGYASYAYTSNATNQTNPFIYDPYNDYAGAIALGVKMDLDVFSKLAEVSRAEAETSLRASQAALAREGVELEVRKLVSEIQGGYRRLKQHKRAARTARGWLFSTTMAYDVGAGDARALVEAFTAWATAKASLDKTRFDTRLAWAALARATAAGAR